MEKKKTILFIDDDQDDRFFFLKAMAVAGPEWACQTAEGGKEALLFLKQASAKPDLIFLDVNMPGMSGWQVLDLLKQDAGLQAIPVIIFSTSSYERDVKTAQRSGATGYCSKPEDFTEMTELIAFVLNNFQKDFSESNLVNYDLKFLRKRNSDS